jgi:hypothetical protein
MAASVMRGAQRRLVDFFMSQVRLLRRVRQGETEVATQIDLMEFKVLVKDCRVKMQLGCPS